jgi:photosystem II stability/assembly factor-like uncharacterized protein
MRYNAASQRVCLTVILLMIGISSHAQVWDTIPPPMEGGYVLSTVRKGHVHYALLGRDFNEQLGRYVADLFKSTDDGESWQQLSLPAEIPAKFHRVALDSLGGIYYFTEWNMYRTTDDGVTWNMITSGIDTFRPVGQLRIDTASRLYLLSGTVGYITSSNGGRTWSPRTLPSPRKMGPNGNIACVGEDLYLWWGYQETADTLYRSTDQGATWNPFLQGRSPLEVIDGGSGRILVSQRMREGGIVPFRILATTDDGQNWDTLFTTNTVGGFVESSIERALFRRSDQGTLAHVLYDTTRVLHILLSPDDGATWTLLSNGNINYRSVVGFNERGHLLVYGGDFGFLRYRTLSGDPERTGFSPLSLNKAPAVLPDGGLYALSEMNREAQIFFWTPATRTWSSLSGRATYYCNPIIKPSASLFTAPPDTLFAPTGRLARTTDMGRTWSNIIPAEVISYGNTSIAAGRWFAVSWDSIYVSGNNGRDWEVMPVPFRPNIPFGIAVENDSAIFYLPGIETEIWRKPVGGSTWSSHSIPWRSVTVVTGMENSLFLCSFSGTEIARSSDQGTSWEELTKGFGTAHELLACAKDTLIALDTTRGLAVSPDRGNSWTRIHLPGIMPRSIAMKGRMLYLGTERLGILRTALENILAPITLSQQPEDEACAPLDLALAWSAPALSGPFRVRFGTDPSLSASTILLDTLVSGSALTLNNLAPGTRYYWDVVAANSQIGTFQSVVSSFRTAQIPVTEISIPVPGAGCVDPNTEIVWTAVDCADSSDVQISSDPEFRSMESATRVYGETNTATVALAYGTNYHARVRSTTSSGQGPWSPVISFRTIDDTVVAPLQSEPADGSTFTTVPPSFIKWSEVDCVERSEIMTARAPDFSADTVAHEIRQNPNNYITLTGELRKNGTYYWKVRAWRDTVPGYWSPVWSFTIDIPLRVEAAPAADDFRILRIHPQPAGARSGSVTVECAIPASTSSELTVYDMLGRARQRVTTARGGQSRQSIPIDISTLPSGQYLIILRGGSRSDVAPLSIVR